MTAYYRATYTVDPSVQEMAFMAKPHRSLIYAGSDESLPAWRQAVVAASRELHLKPLMVLTPGVAFLNQKLEDADDEAELEKSRQEVKVDPALEQFRARWEGVPARVICQTPEPSESDLDLLGYGNVVLTFDGEAGAIATWRKCLRRAGATRGWSSLCSIPEGIACLGADVTTLRMFSRSALVQQASVALSVGRRSESEQKPSIPPDGDQHSRREELLETLAARYGVQAARA